MKESRVAFPGCEVEVRLKDGKHLHRDMVYVTL